MTTQAPQVTSLPLTTVVPETNEKFRPYFADTYQRISTAVSNKDNSFYPMGITSTATDIVGVPQFGAFVINVSAQQVASDGSFPPTLIAALAKSSPTVAGTVALLTSQAGQGGGVWGGVTLTITSTATNYQIAHSGSVPGGFNIRLITTQ